MTAPCSWLSRPHYRIPFGHNPCLPGNSGQCCNRRLASKSKLDVVVSSRFTCRTLQPKTTTSQPVVAPTSSTVLPPVQTFRSPVSHPGYLALGLSAYSLISFDVFSPSSLHILQPIDQALHQGVLANIDPAIRKQLFGGVLSNGPTIAASIGWIFATATAVSRNNPLAWKACGLGWALWIFGVGPIEHDPALMDVLKTSFARVRPSPIHSTASFPSGHTASDVLCVGALLFVLLPVVYGSLQLQAQRQGSGGEVEDGDAAPGAEGNGGVTGSSGGAGGGGEMANRLWAAVYNVQHSWLLWALSAATTIVGRVGVDAHWLSDTLAGGALSLALVSGLASATERMAAGKGGVTKAEAGPEGI